MMSKWTSETYKRNSGCGTIYVTVDVDENNRPIHIFVDNSHGCNSTIKTLSDYISHDLETNKSDLKEIVQILKKSKCDVSIKNENSEGNSCCHIIAKILEEYLPKNPSKPKRVLESPF